MAARLNFVWLRIILSLAIVLGVVAYWVFRPLTETAPGTGGFTPLRDDTLARRLAPRILTHNEYGSPARLLYRMAKSPEGNIHIAYHPFFPEEENRHPGFGARLSRWIYTGGLHLEDVMFGPADIELIEVITDSKRQILEVGYEDAGNYNPRNFSVRHVPKTVHKVQLPLCFAITSWNHMFGLRESTMCANITPLRAEYFAEVDWQKYRMVKKTEAILRRNRMHRVYERVPAL